MSASSISSFSSSAIFWRTKCSFRAAAVLRSESSSSTRCRPAICSSVIPLDRISMTRRASVLRAWRRSRSCGSSHFASPASFSSTWVRAVCRWVYSSCRSSRTRISSLNCSAVFTPKYPSTSAVSSGGLTVFTSLTVNAACTFVPRRAGLATSWDRVMSTVRVSPGLAPVICLPKSSATPSARASRFSTLIRTSSSLFSSFPSRRVDRLVLLRDDLAERLQEPPGLPGDVRVGERVGRAAEPEALVAGQVELRPDLDVELVDEGPGVRDADRARVEFRRAERGDGLLLGELLEAGHQDFRLDLRGDFLLVPPLDDPPGGL